MILFPIVLCASLASMVLAAPVLGYDPDKITQPEPSHLSKRCGDKADKDTSTERSWSEGRTWDDLNKFCGKAVPSSKVDGTHTSKVLTAALIPVARVLNPPGMSIHEKQ